MNLTISPASSVNNINRYNHRRVNNGPSFGRMSSERAAKAVKWSIGGLTGIALGLFAHNGINSSYRVATAARTEICGLLQNMPKTSKGCLDACHKGVGTQKTALAMDKACKTDIDRKGLSDYQPKKVSEIDTILNSQVSLDDLRVSLVKKFTTNKHK